MTTGIMVNSGFLNGMTVKIPAMKMYAWLERTARAKEGQLQAARLGVQPPALLGRAHPHGHCEKCGWVPLPESELPCAAGGGLTSRPITANPRWPDDRLGQHHLPLLRRPRHARDRHHAPVGRLFLVLPALYGPAQRQGAIATKEALEYWTPVDWYNGGMEHTTLHLLYSRFWHKFLYDIGVVPTNEPYAKRTSHGMILGETPMPLRSPAADAERKRLLAEYAPLYEKGAREALVEKAAAWPSNAGIVKMSS